MYNDIIMYNDNRGESMADGAFGNKDYAEVNFAVASDIIDEWTATVNEYASTYKKASENGTFLILEELGISNGFPKRYDEAMEGYSKVVNSLIKELNDYFEELKNKRSNSTVKELEGVLKKYKSLHKYLKTC